MTPERVDNRRRRFAPLNLRRRRYFGVSGLRYLNEIHLETHFNRMAEGQCKIEASHRHVSQIYFLHRLLVLLFQVAVEGDVLVDGEGFTASVAGD